MAIAIPDITCKPGFCKTISDKTGWHSTTTASTSLHRRRRATTNTSPRRRSRRQLLTASTRWKTSRTDRRVHVTRRSSSMMCKQMWRHQYCNWFATGSDCTNTAAQSYTKLKFSTKKLSIKNTHIYILFTAIWQKNYRTRHQLLQATRHRTDRHTLDTYNNMLQDSNTLDRPFHRWLHQTGLKEVDTWLTATIPRDRPGSLQLGTAVLCKQKT